MSDSEDIRHKFSRLTFYTLLLAFLSISMTFIIFSSVAQPTRTCTAGNYISSIGTSSDACSPDFQLHQMGHSSCVITTGTTTCSVNVFYSPIFPATPNVTIADVTNNGAAAFSSSQLLFTGQSDFVESNTTMTINVPKSCSVATPCDLTLFSQHQLALVGLGQQIFQFGMFCKNSNSTSSVSLEVYSSPSLTGTYKETGENLAVTSATCNVAPITLLQDNTGQTDSNLDCANTTQSTPCFYKVRIVNSPGTTVVAITFTKMFLIFYNTISLYPTIVTSAALSDNTVAGITAYIPIILASANSPFIINFTWVAVECVTTAGYKEGAC